MLELDNLKLKRNPMLIQSKTKKVGNTIIAQDKLYVVFPTKFVDKGLTVLGTTTYALGIFAIMDENGNYAVSTIPNKIEIQPTEFDSTVYQNREYTVLVIEKGDTLISNTKLVLDKSVVYDIFGVLYLQGRVPFYLEYLDFIVIFNNLKKYTDSNAARNIITFELLTSIISRSPNDPNIEYREILNALKDMDKIKPSYVGLQNIWYTFKSTISKVAGAYMKLGVVSSIINPEKEVSTLEHIVRE